MPNEITTPPVATRRRTLVIDPVTRIEGHAKITIHLDDAGKVEDARFHITQFRGFEKFVDGRPFAEMPAVMGRICGICPVSHLMASAKACDALLGVTIPETAADLRRIMNLGQIVQSHALSFFHLSSPDLLLGLDSDPGKRHLYGVLEKNPGLARDGITLRKYGQQIIEWLGGKRIHPAWSVPGGVSEPLSVEKRDQILAIIPDALDIARRTLDWYGGILHQFRAEIDTFGNFDSMFLGLVSKPNGPNGEALLEHYDGVLKLVDFDGTVVEDNIDPHCYADYIGEAVVPWSYLKMPYYLKRGYPEGMYRVGPLARLNIVDRPGTPEADVAFGAFKALDKGPVRSSFHFHYARLIEILYGIEKIQQLLNGPDILSTRVRSHADPNCLTGVGCSEAPRGTLMHEYRIDENGLMTWANLIIATGHNNLAMNASVKQVAQTYVDGDNLTEGMLNRVEAVIRTYDPCLSCSTHAVGKMPLKIQLVSPGGNVLDEMCRE